MNSLPAKIARIDTSEGISLVTLELDSKNLVQSIILESPDSVDYLTIGNQIDILFKETEVTLITNEELSISTNNIIRGKITSIEYGTLLCVVSIGISCGTISAVVVREAFDKMNLSKGEMVSALVKTNEIMLSA